MRVVLVSTYDLGRQPFGLASPAAWLRHAGHEVRCLDLAVTEPDEGALRAADVIAFHVPMHTATRLAVKLVPRVRVLNPTARLCCYGLYAPMLAPLWDRLGMEAAIGGEFERALEVFVAEPRSHTPGRASIELERLVFRVPDRSGLPEPSRYARLRAPDATTRATGSTEASRGCKHRCRHCPIVPVYNGRFRVVPIGVVLDDVRQQVQAGATHITFGDPDFWNAIGHAVPLVRRLHAEHPRLTYDVTIKIEHLLRHRDHLETLRETGCLFVTSAVESVDDRVLARLEKGHTRADFLEVVRLCRAQDLALSPTFIPFHPWTTPEGYRELLGLLEDLELVEHVAPIQLAIRLLIPAGSRLLELEEIRRLVGPFDEQALVHPWQHPDAGVDRLGRDVLELVAAGAREGHSRPELFRRVAERAGAREAPQRGGAPGAARFRRPPVPFLTEPWYC